MKKFLLVLCVLLAACSPAFSASYRMDEDGQVYRNGKIIRNAELYPVDGTVLKWMNDNNAVYIFNPANPEKAPVRVSLRKGEKCTDVYTGYSDSFVLSLQSNYLLIVGANGKTIERVPGFGPIFWVDEYRFVFTSCIPNRKRPGGQLWLGAAVFEYFVDGAGITETLTTPIAEPTETENYVVSGFDGVTCLVVIDEVSSPEEWSDPDRNPNETLREVHMELPAAG